MKEINGRLPGHAPDCFLPSGQYLRCAPGCQAQATWSSQQEEAYAAYQPDLEKWRADGAGTGATAPSKSNSGKKEKVTP